MKNYTWIKNVLNIQFNIRARQLKTPWRFNLTPIIMTVNDEVDIREETFNHC